MVDTSRTCFAK